MGCTLLSTDDGIFSTGEHSDGEDIFGERDKASNHSYSSVNKTALSQVQLHKNEKPLNLLFTELNTDSAESFLEKEEFLVPIKPSPPFASYSTFQLLKMKEDKEPDPVVVLDDVEVDSDKADSYFVSPFVTRRFPAAAHIPFLPSPSVLPLPVTSSPRASSLQADKLSSYSRSNCSATKKSKHWRKSHVSKKSKVKFDKDTPKGNDVGQDKDHLQEVLKDSTLKSCEAEVLKKTENTGTPKSRHHSSSSPPKEIAQRLNLD